MQNPGSNPDIPIEADVEFEEQWDRTRPGVKRKIAYLELENERRLVVFPHREWNAPIGRQGRVVLFPVRNAAVAAPVGGIPESERISATTGSVEHPREDHGREDHGREDHGREDHGREDHGREPASIVPITAVHRDAYSRIVELLEPIDRAYSKLDEGMEQLNEALDKLTEVVRQYRPVDEPAETGR
jgi:hypothetical protein